MSYKCVFLSNKMRYIVQAVNLGIERYKGIDFFGMSKFFFCVLL